MTTSKCVCGGSTNYPFHSPQYCGKPCEVEGTLIQDDPMRYAHGDVGEIRTDGTAAPNKKPSESEIQSAYRIVIAHLRGEEHKCTDHSPFCVGCISKRLADDLEAVLALCFDESLPLDEQAR